MKLTDLLPILREVNLLLGFVQILCPHFVYQLMTVLRGVGNNDKTEVFMNKTLVQEEKILPYSPLLCKNPLHVALVYHLFDFEMNKY